MTLTKRPDSPRTDAKEYHGCYLIRRLLLVIPTLWAIITINFFIVQIAPGGPVDQAIAAIEFGNRGGMPAPATAGWAPAMRVPASGNISESHYRGGRGLDPEVIAEITHRYGFDKPLHERYFKMLWDYLRFDFGDSLFRSASVLQLIKTACRSRSPWAVEYADYLSGLDSAGDPQSGQQRQPL
jgi:microcin C transport system permease protein